MRTKTNITKRYRIHFADMEDVRAFVDAVNCLEGKCELISERYRVNAKSLIAVLTLPMRSEMTIEVEGLRTELPKQLQRFIC